MSKLTAFLKKEFREMVPPTLFFFVVFETVVLARSLMGHEQDISMTTTGAAAVGALVMGKAILVADALPLFRWFRRRLVVNVAWRALLYMLVTLVFQVLEELIPLARREGLGAAVSELGGDIHWPRLWATHILLAVFLLFYSFATAAIEVIGEERFRALFFGGRSLDAPRDEPAA